MTINFTSDELINCYLIAPLDQKETVMVVLLDQLRQEGLTDKQIIKKLGGTNKENKAFRDYLKYMLNNICLCENCSTLLN